LQRMLRVPLIFFFSILTIFYCRGQQNIVLQGTVRNENTGEAVPFAHIGICGKAIGTVSNENGEFRLNIMSYLAADTLCVSSIGFETFMAPVAGFGSRSGISILLFPQTEILNEVIVSGEKITARRVLAKAIERISKNCPSRPFILEGYYRDYLKKDNDYISFLESAISVQDPGINKPESRTRVRLNQIRYNNHYIDNFLKYCVKDRSDTVKEIMEGFSPFVNGNEFTNMNANNPIRNHSTEIAIVGLFDRFYMSNLKFEIAYNTEVDEREVYVIKFQPTDLYRYHHVQVGGEVYIRAEDFAILKFEYNYYISLFRERKKLYELNVEYREFGNKMFLNYISFVNYFKIYTGDEIAELYQYREFFVNNIHYPKFDPIAEDEMLDSSRPLYEYRMEPDPGFWENYNAVLLEKPFKN
jgi:hypothetical protein